MDCNHVIVKLGLEMASRGHLLFDLPEWAYEATKDGERGDVGWLFVGPVVGGKSSSQRAMAQSNDEVDAPEKSQHVVDVQVLEVAPNGVLGAVAGEDAPGRGAARVIWWREVLRGKDGGRNERRT